MAAQALAAERADRIDTDLGEIAYYALGRDFVDVFGLTSGGFAGSPSRNPS